jgi:adenylylsulfate kinase-like enzyme
MLKKAGSWGGRLVGSRAGLSLTNPSDMPVIVDRLAASARQPALLPGVAGIVVWITGLSGAGKTTLGTDLADRLRRAGLPVIRLDGDELRAAFATGVGYAESDRRALAHAYGRLCRDVSLKGLHVVCSTISMFHSAREANRSAIPRYFEVYLRVPVEELRRRDPKLIYRRAAHGAADPVVGAAAPPEEPADADITIDHGEGLTAQGTADRVWQHLLRTHDIFAGTDVGRGPAATGEHAHDR